MTLTAIDLFCGCGGLSLGLEQAGFRVIGAIDDDPLAVDSYKLNHKDTDAWVGDLSTLTTSNVKRRLGIRKGELDLLAGCPPCQGFSTLRSLNGGRKITEAKNDLVFDFLRFVVDLRPRAVMMENVPGLAVDERMQSLSDELKRLGYKGTARVLDAAEFGVPQRRRRMIYLATRGRRPIPFPPPGTKRVTVHDVIAALPKAGSSGDPLHDVSETRSQKVTELVKRIPKDGGSRRDLGDDQQLDCHKRTNGFYDVYGRMAWLEVSPTITGGFVNPSKGRFLHPAEDRCITLREGALLQGLPPDYAFSFDRGKYAVAQMIGNALPPEFIRRHAAVVADALRMRKSTRAKAPRPRADR